MTAKSLRLWAPVLAVALLTLVSCTSGGGNEPPVIGPAFSLIVSANPDTGAAPLTVTFFAVPSGGQAPYSFAWDYDADGVSDSNAASGSHPYTQSGVATVTVTDSAGKVVTSSKTITITAEGPPPAGQELGVTFTAEPPVGNVPFNCQFHGYATGGKAPYSFAWDFEGDGIFDSFIQAPLWTFEQVGQVVGTGNDKYLYYPVLRVTDGRGVVRTNLDDQDGNGQPDYKLPINALPPGIMAVAAIANPLNGQAPLTVEFTGSVTGGSGNYEFRWNFGDGAETAYAATSIATHTYVSPGIYLATVTVHDKTIDMLATSYPLNINATPDQPFTLAISSDVATGQVPFVASMIAEPVNGQEPIVYQWDVFDDVTPAELEPSVSEPPTLSSAAVITPNFSFRKNPAIHFANTAGDAGAHSYVVRCAARDAAGNETLSNLIRVVASPNVTFPYYEAHRPGIVGFTFFPFQSAQPAIQDVNPPAPWSARANPAVCAHPTGVSFIIGGETLDSNGDFEDLVLPGDSVYMYVPRANATGTGEGTIGEFNTGTQGGGLIRLNDGYAPAFPGQADRNPPPVPSVRSSAFTIVGSAAAVFIHEIPESNPAGQYQAQRNDPDWMALSPYPDSPDTGWKLDSPPFVTSGLGSPVIYVLGGRTDATTPSNLVQKYYVYGFGSEGMRYDCGNPLVDGSPYAFQTTGNQTDIWSPFYVRPDTDHYPPQDAEPVIEDRRPGNDAASPLPTLPVAVYGLMACRVETAVDQASPSFPDGPFRLIFTFGGITETGAVLDEMRVWNTATQPDTGSGEPAGSQPGVFSEVSAMPTPRAYGSALLIPGNPMRIALIGGYDQNGVPLNTVDVFTFDNSFNPGGGSWETFGGTLPEALEACGAGYNDRAEPAQSWVMAFGGWTGERFSTNTYNARLRSPGDIVIREPMAVVPRSHLGSTQSGSGVIGVSYNRYFMFGGVDENGTDTIAEIVSLP